MKRILLILAALTPAIMHAAEPIELVSARASYQRQIKIATDPINTRYLEYLENLKKVLGGKGDVEGALAVQREIESVAGIKAVEVSGGSDKIVIWNQNNGGKGDRGSKKVTVKLLAGGREVWSKKFVKLDWDPVKQTKVEIPVPTMTSDKLRVEVTDSVNGKGGLAEVEFFRGGKNVAAGGDVTVSAFWENNPKHAGKMLTDGLPGTFWLLQDNQDGWAEIALKP
ncbi:MAG: hypothetical protein HS117_24265 [Verrucomicrobiaceae bacterium]|jgi:hypothetical protein|nr:hypothetical protein [Verrucomicrobiaceae bacterium]